jgi:hypothetical protein
MSGGTKRQCDRALGTPSTIVAEPVKQPSMSGHDVVPSGFNAWPSSAHRARSFEM